MEKRMEGFMVAGKGLQRFNYFGTLTQLKSE